MDLARSSSVPCVRYAANGLLLSSFNLLLYVCLSVCLVPVLSSPHRHDGYLASLSFSWSVVFLIYPLYQHFISFVGSTLSSYQSRHDTSIALSELSDGGRNREKDRGTVAEL
jgi:hypothetical protein